MPQDVPTCPYHGFRPPHALREHQLCAWTIGPASGGHETTLPDGTIDIVWGEATAPVVAGPHTGPVPSTRPPGTTVVGVSFRPGAAPALLGIPADELRDLRVPLGDVWDGNAPLLEQGFDGGSSPSIRLDLIERELRRRLLGAKRPDDLVTAAVARLRGPAPNHVRAIGDELGISERQLRRRFRGAVGYGPKTLARVLRFQRMLALARRRATCDLGHLAIDAGYADQAHMTVECTRLAGVPPARLLAERYLIQPTQ
jgi:AraC-like DNA-binding protein